MYRVHRVWHGWLGTRGKIVELVNRGCFPLLHHENKSPKEDLERNMTVILRMTSVIRRRIFSFNNQYKLCVSVLTQKSLLRFGNAMLRIVVRLSVYRTPSTVKSPHAHRGSHYVVRSRDKKQSKEWNHSRHFIGDEEWVP